MKTISKRERNISNYLKKLEANSKYIDYVNSFGEKNNLSKDDLNYLKVGYASFLLFLWKDDFIKKDSNKNLSTTLIEENLEKATSIISTKSNNKWKIDNIEFSNYLEVLDKVRNKLAHGDYEIIDGYVYLEIDGQIGKIEIDKLVGLVSTIACSWDDIRKYGERITGIIKDTKVSKKKQIRSAKDLDEVLNNIYYVKIVDKPRMLRVRNNDYVKMMYFLKDAVKKRIINELNVEKIVDNSNNKHLLENAGIDVTVTEFPARKLESTKKVRTMFLSKLDLIKNMSPEIQHIYLDYWFHEAETKKMRKGSISFGLTANTVFFKELEKDNTKDVQNIVENNEYGILLATLNEKTIISAYLTSFYFIYIYSLDNILNIKDKEDIRNIVTNKTFDFSKLDLDSIGSYINNEEKEYPEFTEQINKILKDIEMLEKKVIKLENNIKGIEKVLEKDKSKQEKYNELKKIQDEVLEKIELLKEQYNKANLFMQNNYEKYKKNRSIIEHIRNSIAHGNIELDIFNGDCTVDDATITFKDIHQGITTFELQVLAKDFNKLNSHENINKIISFIEHKEEDKEKQRKLT